MKSINSGEIGTCEDFEWWSPVQEKYEAMLKDNSLDTHAHLPFLYEVAKGNILEIGVHCGISTTALLAGLEEHGGHLWSVDIHTSCRYIWYGHKQWTFFCTDSKSLDFPSGNPLFDVVFIDGDHSYEGCLSDLERWGTKVKNGGLILCHDAEAGNFPGVIKSISEFCDKRNLQHETRHGSFGLEVIWYRC